MITNSELKSIQEKELEIMMKVDELCKKYNLTYYLIGGSALGAVRHNGFIPWDDDIDIGLPRQDYEKLLEICKRELPPGYFIQNQFTDPNYYKNYAKVRDCRTTFIEYEVRNVDINHGIFIDIFPIDGVPKNRILQKLQCKLIKATSSIQVSIALKRYSRNFVKRMIQRLCSIIPLRYWVYISDRILSIVPAKSSELWGNLLGKGGYEKEIMPRSFFGKPQECIFESKNLPIPQEYKKYLTKLYGDYMKLPPVAERRPHDVYIIDTSKPFTYYK